MGWLFHNDMLQSQTPAEYIAEQYSRETDVYRVNVLATATVGGFRLQEPGRSHGSLPNRLSRPDHAPPLSRR